MSMKAMKYLTGVETNPELKRIWDEATEKRKQYQEREDFLKSQAKKLHEESVEYQKVVRKLVEVEVRKIGLISHDVKEPILEFNEVGQLFLVDSQKCDCLTCQVKRRVGL